MEKVDVCSLDFSKTSAVVEFVGGKSIKHLRVPLSLLASESFGAEMSCCMDKLDEAKRAALCALGRLYRTEPELECGSCVDSGLVERAEQKIKEFVGELLFGDVNDPELMNFLGELLVLSAMGISALKEITESELVIKVHINQ